MLAVRLPLRGGRCAVRRWCGIGCVRSPLKSAALDARLRDAPWGLAHSACVCAGIAQERFPCVARCMDAPRTFCVTVPRLCTRRALSAVLWRPAHSARICAAPFIVALALCGGRKRQENYTASRPSPPHSLLRIHLFARCYSSASRHSKRVDARFARRTVYRPPSGELVMVLMR